MVRDDEVGRSCPLDLGESIRPASGEHILLWTNPYPCDSEPHPVPSQPSNETHLCRLPSYLEDDGEAVMATAENKRPRLSSRAEKKPSRKEVLLFSLLFSIGLASLSSYVLLVDFLVFLYPH